MIHIPTTLILGAGASMPYGFPSGAGLRELLCDSNQTRFLYEQGAFKKDDVKAFVHAFFHSGVESIDAFLARRGAHIAPSETATFGEIGKAAIALILIRFEQRESLFRRQVNFDNWYQYLWRFLGTSLEDFVTAPLSIVTFNYDRSLEFYLWLALQNAFGITESEAFEKLSSLNIVHVYGKLGELPSPGASPESVRGYEPEPSLESISVAARGINVIAESRSDAATFMAARAALQSAERICFLGFGFDPTNVERLRLLEVLEESYSQKRFKLPMTFATTVGLKTFERSAVAQMLQPNHQNIATRAKDERANFRDSQQQVMQHVQEFSNEENTNYLRHTGVFERP